MCEAARMLATERAGRVFFSLPALAALARRHGPHTPDRRRYASRRECEQSRHILHTYHVCATDPLPPWQIPPPDVERLPVFPGIHRPQRLSLRAQVRQTGPLTSRCKLMRRSCRHEYCWGQAAEKGRPQSLARARLRRVARRHPSAHASRADCHLFLLCCRWHARRHVLAAARGGRPNRLRPDRSFAQAQARNPRASGHPQHLQDAAPARSRPRRLRWPIAPTFRSPLPLPWLRALRRTRTGEAGAGWVEGGRHGWRRRR